jgi:LysR family transcriptional activator of nhaA
MSTNQKSSQTRLISSMKESRIHALNYHHLHVFWTVAREGTLAKASVVLGVTQPTISAQLRVLEEALGEQLFVRSGRKLVLSDTGRLVYSYASEIFQLGNELVETLQGRPTGQMPRFAVGIGESVPKRVAYLLIEPALQMEKPVHLECHEGRTRELLAELALHRLDLVLADSPLPPDPKIKAYNHILGECGVSVLGQKGKFASYRASFPGCLHDAPMLLPTTNTAMRRSLEAWFDKENIQPRIVAEFEDSALMKVFGQSGLGLFTIPTLLESEVCEQYGVELIGRAPQVRERFYAISVERKIRHPAVQAICAAAREELFQRVR